MDLTLTIISTPSLRSSVKRAVEYLERTSFDRLLLPFPEAFNHLLQRLIRGEASLDELLSEASEMGCLPEPMGYFKHLYEPLMRAMPIMKKRLPGLDVSCYRDSEDASKVNALAVYKASLTLYTAINGKVRVREWRSLLEEELEVDEASIRDAAKNIIGACSPFSRVICMAHLEGRHLYQRLKEAIRRIRHRYIGLPYIFTPLEALKRLISIRGLSGIPDEVIEEGVKLHVEYVRDYVVPSRELEAGYVRWLIRNFKVGGYPAPQAI